MQLLYKGFNQRANIRSYRFDGVVPSERPSRIVKNLEFLLKLDMTVLAEHRIRIQEAPGFVPGNSADRLGDARRRHNSLPELHHHTRGNPGLRLSPRCAGGSQRHAAQASPALQTHYARAVEMAGAVKAASTEGASPG
jgi:hypothetical protein